MGMKYEALKNGLEALIGQMQGLIADGDYGENEEMEKGDVKSAMEGAEEELNEEMPSKEMPEEMPLGDEVSKFMKSKNVGKRPKGLKAIMVEASIAKKPPMGFKKGKM